MSENNLNVNSVMKKGETKMGNEMGVVGRQKVK